MALTNEKKKKEISDKVNAILQDFGYNPKEDTYVDSVKLANSLGFKVGETRNLLPNEDGFIIMFEDLKVIGVNDHRSVEDKRFTTAHELGHFVLHKEDLQQNMMMREHIHEKIGNIKEYEADFFAACVLMPEESFKKELNRLKQIGLNRDEIVSFLRRMFRVPEESIIRRIKEVSV